ncbi:hypothetical protein [Methanogenium sp. MK-MG]|uniref:hypothetical protein n=1 Tax=Methanogenium sp. MK-MG TaxID=2599926 RepID=UPI0013EDC27B|nr:hypothetical protein [Methanogenium sp. MK-MG]KAF1078760.1 hypothetical protein MKMG_00310 [Methanogenium sp. MK-MG]
MMRSLSATAVVFILSAAGDSGTDAAAILDIFTRIAAIPRCSGNEEGAARFILDRAAAAGFMAEEDPAGKVFITRKSAGIRLLSRSFGMPGSIC